MHHRLRDIWRKIADIVMESLHSSSDREPAREDLGAFRQVNECNRLFTTIKNVYVAAGKSVEGSEDQPFYCSFAYSALASFRIGISRSASFQTLKKS